MLAARLCGRRRGGLVTGQLRLLVRGGRVPADHVIASRQPSRGLISTTLSGTFQLHAWSVADGRLTQLTRSAQGVLSGLLAPDGDTQVSAQTMIPRSFNSRSMALSNLGPRQTSARTAAGTLTNARRSCATCRIARERSANTAPSVACASALTASESRISASATNAWPWQVRLCSPVRARPRAQRETRRVVLARVRAPSREPQIPTGLELCSVAAEAFSIISKCAAPSSLSWRKVLAAMKKSSRKNRQQISADRPRSSPCNPNTNTTTLGLGRSLARIG